MPSKATPARSTKNLSSDSKSTPMAMKKERTSRPSKSQGNSPASKSQITKTPTPKKSILSLYAGDPAPDFSLPDETGKLVSLSAFRGKKVVLYFYPKDDTPGCTTEACSFRDTHQNLKKKGAVVFGVSADSVSSHRKFSEKFQLNFPLLSDESKTMIQAYGVWKEKTLYGRKFMGIERTTVVISEDGTIKRVFPKVKVNGHIAEVLQALG